MKNTRFGIEIQFIRYEKPERDVDPFPVRETVAFCPGEGPELPVKTIRHKGTTYEVGDTHLDLDRSLIIISATWVAYGVFH